jgi:hypothetical protein
MTGRRRDKGQQTTRGTTKKDLKQPASSRYKEVLSHSKITCRMMRGTGSSIHRVLVDKNGGLLMNDKNPTVTYVPIGTAEEKNKFAPTFSC